MIAVNCKDRETDVYILVTEVGLYASDFDWDFFLAENIWLEKI